MNSSYYNNIINITLRYTNYNFIMGVVAVPDLRAMLGVVKCPLRYIYGKHFCIEVCRSGCFTVSVVRSREAVASRGVSIASSPGLQGEGKGRPGTHCMRHVFRIFYHKSVRKSTGRTCSYHGEGLPK